MLSVPQDFRVIALICAFNEEDVIYQVIRHHIEQGVEVYLMDNNSTDDTVKEASKLLGRGLIHIENFPQDAGYPEQNEKKFVLKDILRRKEELSRQLNANWFIHGDADELRYGPWPDLTLRESIYKVDSLGYNLINHKNFHFLPSDNSFTPGADLRKHLTHYHERAWFISPQQKIFKKPAQPFDLGIHGGHLQAFEGMKLFPIRFMLLHYPLRNEELGREKVEHNRLNRYAQEGLKQGWHFHYRHLAEGKGQIIRTPEESGMVLFDLDKERLRILSEYSQDITLMEKVTKKEVSMQNLDIESVVEWMRPFIPGFQEKKLYESFSLCKEMIEKINDPYQKDQYKIADDINDENAIYLQHIFKILLATQSLQQLAKVARNTTDIINTCKKHIK